MRPRNHQEEEWIRMMLNEKLDAEVVHRIQKELNEDFFQKERYVAIKSVVENVNDHYESQKDPVHDLTHEQKEEVYAHITSVFDTRKSKLKIEWIPQLKFAFAVMFGTVALVASVPFFEWVSEPIRPLNYDKEGTLPTYESPSVVVLPPRNKEEEPMLEPVEVFDEILLKPDEDYEPLACRLLPWESMGMDFGTPSLDIPEFDFEESIISLIDADVPPVPVNQFAPSFPSEARRNHLNGRVIVEFVVDKSGLVQKPRIASSSHRIFESPAIDAIRKWRFEPGEKDGEEVKVSMRMPFVFNYHR